MTLRDVKLGESAIITSVGGEGALRQHFLDMGVIPGAEVTVVKFAPMGDPVELLIHGYELTLRLADAEKIGVEKKQHADPEETDSENVGNTSGKSGKSDSDKLKSNKAKSGKSDSDKSGIDKTNNGRESASETGKSNRDTAREALDDNKKHEHPGFGEGGKYHPKGSGNPLPEGTKLTFALVGNQNCGKTTLFNQLTGSNQHVGNFPGVTVDRKDGPIKGYPNTLVTDLPGIYSMSPYTNEEIVSRSFVIESKPTAIINIIDATNIERNLYLTMQLLEMNVPMVVALNMMDELTANKGSVDINKMERLLGVPVVPISAAKNAGIRELIEHAIHIAKYQEKPSRQDFCDEKDYGGAVHRCIHAVSHLIEDHAVKYNLPVRFAATKVIEGDPLVIKQLELDQNEEETVDHIVKQMEVERGLDKSAAIADMRFAFIKKVCAKSVKKPKMSKERVRSEKIDRILTGKFTAIPAFIIIMGLTFFLTFNVIGAFLQGILETGIDALTEVVASGLEACNVNEALQGLILDGIFAGVGSVLSFMPVIVTLFFFLSMLEDSGYIARVAFVMDRLLRKIGLSGRSIVPMLIGFGCTVPAVMATRTLPSERDRRMTILLTPFMSCSAKMPIYAFFVSVFFPKQGGLIFLGLYLLGILTGILVAFLYRGLLFKGEAIPFVMELPNYRLPGAKNVCQLLWEKAKDFLQRAFSVILIATIVIWILQSFNFSFRFVEDSKDSILATIAGWMAPFLAPAGLGDWRIATSLITGFMAKESVVSTLQILFGQDIQATMTTVQAAALLVFTLLYTPCVAAIAAIKRELGSKWAICVVIWQCGVAWLAAVLVNFIGGML